MRWVHDTGTGAVRDVPAGASVINAAGATAGVRLSGKKDSGGVCDDLEVFVHHADGTVEVLGNPVGGNYGGMGCRARESREVSALDDDGTVVAQWVSLQGGTIAAEVYVWAGKSWQKLPGLGGETHKAHAAVGGVIAGESTTPRAANLSQDQHAVIWRDGKLIDLGDAGNCCDSAQAINARGQVVGQHTVNAVSRAFLWSDGRAADLGTLAPFESSIANSINRDGTIVGSARYFSWEGRGASRAVLFSGGKVYDLNDLVDRHDLLLATAIRISDAGVIAVYAAPLQRAIVLVPTGAPPLPDRSWRAKGDVLVSSELASGLAVDATDVYFITVSASRQVSIKSVPKSGGTVRTLFHTDRGFSYGNLVVDDKNLWFDLTACSGAVCEDQSGVWRMAKAGGNAEWFSDGSRWLGLGSTAIYATRAVGPSEDLISTPKAGGAPVVHVAATDFAGIALDGDQAYFLKEEWVGNFRRTVLWVESSGNVTELTVAPFGFSGGPMILDDASIFVRGPAQLWRFPRAGGAPEAIANIAGGDGYRNEIGTDGRFVYWTQQAESGKPACVARVGAQRGEPQCLDSGYWRYASVRVDEGAVYFIRDTEIVRLPK
jgi:probable HAF family extracellular repeat protein